MGEGAAVPLRAASAASLARPPRPSVPPLLLVALCFWASCCIALNLMSGQSGAYMMVAVCSAALCVLSGLLAAVCRRGKVAFLCLLGCALGALAASGCAWNLGAMESALQDGAPSGPHRFLIVEDPSQNDFGKSCFAQVSLEDGRAVRVRLSLPDDAGVSCWDTIEAWGALKPATDKNRGYLWQHGACGQVTVRSYDEAETGGLLGALGRVRDAAVSLYQGRGSDGAALMRALLFGDRGQLFESAVYDDIKRDGIAHMVAVSGAHLVVVSGFAAMALQALHVPRRFIIALMAVFIAAYIVLTGAPVSALRAGAMTVCSLSAFYAKRRAAPASALGIAILCLVGSAPSCALSVSFSLSALATLGILLFGRYFQLWMRSMFANRFRGLSDTLGFTVAANLFTLPVSVSAFGQLSLIAPIANAVCGPLFSVLCVGGMLCTLVAAAVLPLRSFALSVACNSGQAFCELASLLAAVPHAAIAADGSLPVLLAVTFAAACALLAAWPPPRMRAGWAAVATGVVCLAVAVAVLPLLHGSEIIMLDVGQGDSFVLRSAGRAVMIDTGTDDAKVLRALARHDVRHLDAVVITHPDDDHCGSLAAVRAYTTVERVCVARDLLSCPCENCAKLRSQLEGVETCALDVGSRLVFGGFTATALSPAAFEDEGGNADSLVMRVTCDADGNGSPETSALFTGDAEAEVLDGLDEQGALSQVDILKVPHHGSKAGLDERVMERLRPRLALISVGEGNRYGHPKQETLDLLESFGCQVVRTDQSGDVVCSLDGSGAKVRTER